MRCLPVSVSFLPQPAVVRLVDHVVAPVSHLRVVLFRARDERPRAAPAVFRGVDLRAVVRPPALVLRGVALRAGAVFLRPLVLLRAVAFLAAVFFCAPVVVDLRAEVFFAPAAVFLAPEVLLAPVVLRPVPLRDDAARRVVFLPAGALLPREARDSLAEGALSGDLSDD